MFTGPAPRKLPWSDTGLVTPWIVRLPSIVSLPPSPGVTFVLLKTSVGKLSTEKKFGLLRSLSRWSLFVKMLAAWMVASTDERDRSFSSSWIVPAKSLKRPGTREKKWRMVKLTCECAGSILNGRGAAADGVAGGTAAAAPSGRGG